MVRKMLYMMLVVTLSIVLSSCTIRKDTAVETKEPEVILSKLNEENTKEKKDTLIKGYSVIYEENIDIVNDVIEVIDKKEVTKEEAIDIDVHIPVVEGLKNINVQNKINLLLESEIQYFKNEIIESAKKAKKEAEEFKIKLQPYYVGTNYEVTYNKGDILSIVITYSKYTGGAHAVYENKSYNFDLNNGNTAMLADLFHEVEDYNNIILEEIKRQANEKPDKYFMDVVNKIEQLPFNQQFYIQDNNLVVYFGLYEIAPFIGGISEFKIPFSLFKSGIKSEINVTKPYAIVRTMGLTDKIGEIEFFCNKPVIYNLEDKQFLKKINDAINNEIENLKEQVSKYDKEEDITLVMASVEYDFVYKDKDDFIVGLKYAVNEDNQSIEVGTKKFNINTKDKIIDIIK